MYEFVEKILASLIVLVMLVIVMILAFPDRLTDTNDAVQTQPTAEDQTGPTPLPKGNAKQLKIVERLADSSNNQKPLYRRLRRPAQTATPRPPKRKRYYVETRHTTYSAPRYYSYRDDDTESDYESSYGDCEGAACLCNCRPPYWAREAGYDYEDCW